MSTWITRLLVMILSLHSITVMAAPAPSPIEIGVIYNLTGAQSSLDIFSANGAKLAASEINANGGILGRPIHLIIKDGESNLNTIKEIAKEFGKDKDVVAVVGLSDTDMALAAIPTLAMHHKLFITSGATGPELPNTAPEWVFLSCFSDDEQASSAAIFAFLSLGKKSALVIEQNDSSFARLLSDYFKRSFIQAGGTITATKEFNRQESNLSSKLKALKESPTQPEIIFLAAGPETAIQMIKQIRAAGFTQPIVGGDNLDSEDLDDQPAESIGVVYFTAHAFINPSSNDKKIQNFITAYKSTYGTLPDVSFAGLGYDVIKLLVKAIELAKSTDSNLIRIQLLKLKYDGVTGAMDFSNHYIPKKTVTFVRFENGKRTAVTF